MVIDFHTHIFPDKIAARTIAMLEGAADVKAATNGTLNGLLSSMERCGVDLSVILPVVTKPSQFESVNSFAAFLNREYGSRVISFGGIHPDCEDYRGELEQIRALGLPGVKIHPDYQGVMIDDVRYMNIIEYADALGLIIVTHAGIDIGLPDPVRCPPERMRKVLDRLKPKKMVLAHCGGWRQWEAVQEYLAGENVYLDTAFTFDYISQDMFMNIWDKHDHDKILFATDSPWSDAERDMTAVKNLPITELEKEQIFSGNGKRLLRMEEK